MLNCNLYLGIAYVFNCYTFLSFHSHNKHNIIIRIKLRCQLHSSLNSIFYFALLFLLYCHFICYWNSIIERTGAAYNCTLSLTSKRTKWNQKAAFELAAHSLDRWRRQRRHRRRQRRRRRVNGAWNEIQLKSNRNAVSRGAAAKLGLVLPHRRIVY